MSRYIESNGIKYKSYTLDEVPEELKNTEEYKYILSTIEDKLDEDGSGFCLCDYITFIDENNNFKLDPDGKPYCVFEGLEYYC